MKSFDQLIEPEILALAISSEEEDGRIYADFAEGLREDHPDTAQVFSDNGVFRGFHDGGKRSSLSLIMLKLQSPFANTSLQRLPPLAQ